MKSSEKYPPTRRSADFQPVAVHPYKLRFSKTSIFDHREATLTSPVLDSVLHPEASVHVLLANRTSGGKKAAGALLDPFVQASLQTYLNTQDQIRTTLEAELIKARDAWDKNQRFGRPDIWFHSRIESVTFERKKVPTAESLAKLKKVFPKMDLVLVRAKSDKPDTRSSFTIQVHVAWAADHSEWLFTFRDALLADFSCQ